SNKNRNGVLIQCPDSKDVSYVIPNAGSIQLDELLALLKVLVECQIEPFNIFLTANMLYRQFCLLQHIQQQQVATKHLRFLQQPTTAAMPKKMLDEMLKEVKAR
ncbi:hypothetical protein A6R68_22228, partial [Neotoma lepida]